MPTLALFLFRFARLLFSGHAAVAAENAALRLQLAAFQRQRTTRSDFPRPTVLGRTLPAVEVLALSPDERLIGSIRRDSLNHFIIFNARHLKRTLSSYFTYYHGSRTHLGLASNVHMFGRS